MAMDEGAPPEFGDVWTAPAATLAEIMGSGDAPADRLRAALARGFFSTYAAMRDAALTGRLVDWQLGLLAPRWGASLEALPAACEEIACHPPAATVARFGRRLSADLLRNVWYVGQVMAAIDPGAARVAPRLLEIGSGNGAFAFVLKALVPGARACLVDLPPSLAVAELYLREALPRARIVRLEPADGRAPRDIDCDFLLVPIDQAHRLAGERFDLAANIWSFGEMPNDFIVRWFRLLRRDCEVAHLFVLNAFLSPVTRETPERTRQGDWLMQLDSAWRMLRFDIDPPIHRCPFLKDFHKGLMFVAARSGPGADPGEKARAAAVACAARVADWVGIAREGGEVSVSRLRARTDYTAHFSLEDGMEGPVYAFWNDLRQNGSVVSGELLVAYLAMVARSDPAAHCTKEELFLLRRLPPGSVHEEYRRLLRDSPGDAIEYEGESLGIQSACDRALARMRAGDLAAAEVLFARVAAAAPAHGDCWYYLALLAERHDDRANAAAMARHASMLAPDYAHYRELLDRLTPAVPRPSWLARLAESVRPAAAQRLTRAADALGQGASPLRIPVAAFLEGGDGHECFCALADSARALGNVSLVEAFETAAAAQLVMARRARGPDAAASREGR